MALQPKKLLTSNAEAEQPPAEIVRKSSKGSRRTKNSQLQCRSSTSIEETGKEGPGRSKGSGRRLRLRTVAPSSEPLIPLKSAPPACSMAASSQERQETSEAQVVEMLQVLSHRQLRACHAADILPVTQMLDLVFPLVGTVDEELAKYLRPVSEELPYSAFAMSWVLTWFAHDVDQILVIQRLYDFFLVSHPLMPFYFAASLIIYRRQTLIAQGPHPNAAEIYALIQTFPRQKSWDLDEIEYLVAFSRHLFHRVPPQRFLALSKPALPYDPFCPWYGPDLIAPSASLVLPSDAAFSSRLLKFFPPIALQKKTKKKRRLIKLKKK